MRRPARALWRAIVAVTLLRAGALRRRRAARVPADPSQRRTGTAGMLEGVVAALLLATAAGAAGFAALFILDPNTQLLGLALGLALSSLAAALVVAGKRLVPRETKEEERPGLSHPREVEPVVEQVRAGGEGITRRRLLGSAAGVAGAGVAAAAVVPLAALGPGLTDQLSRSPWRAGRRLVDEEGTPVAARDVRRGSFLTAFPEGVQHDDLRAPVVVVRVDPATLRLPAERSRWAPQGILAYSKICTHAACAISLYRSPLNPGTQARGPALVCPCHYSTFDVLRGASVEFGPAGRPLPQLALSIDASGMLRAAGPLSGPVGPSWWGDRT
jgi:ubiquinol-cytochrome c reductase iron-sulfur subunit